MNLTKDGAIEAIKAEGSTAFPAWRPVTAAALHALAGRDGDQVWMTLAEFAQWRERMGIIGARHVYAKIDDLIGMKATRVKTILAGGKISRMESLACAHALMGMKAPVEAGDVDAFASWFQTRFGAVKPVADFLRYGDAHLGDRIRGYGIVRGQRVTRAPEIDLIRALDWLDVVGPWSPFGLRPPVKTWPEQGVF